MPEGRKLLIDVVSDVVCPWCFLGERSLAAALAAFPGVDAKVNWRPFQLDPTIPPGGMNRQEYVQRKFGSIDRLESAHRQMEIRGRSVGIEYAFDRISRSPNTLDAHRLIRWAGEAGCQDAVVDGLFSLYFSEGADIGEHHVLAKVAGQAGMDSQKVAADLSTDLDRDAVEAEIAAAARSGVTGVPFFIFANRYAVSGAQPVEALVDVIRQVLEKTAGQELPG